MTAGHVFTKAERKYLLSLPAVCAIGDNDRIFYSDGFRREALERYEAGDSPARIFRDAGLDPKLIGHKRVERAMARWRKGAAASHVSPPVTAERKSTTVPYSVFLAQTERLNELEEKVRELTELAQAFGRGQGAGPVAARPVNA